MVPQCTTLSAAPPSDKAPEVGGGGALFLFLDLILPLVGLWLMIVWVVEEGGGREGAPLLLRSGSLVYTLDGGAPNLMGDDCM